MTCSATSRSAKFTVVRGTPRVRDGRETLPRQTIGCSLQLKTRHVRHATDAIVPLKRLVIDAALEFRIAEIDNAVEHGGKVPIDDESRPRCASRRSEKRQVYRSPPLCASVAFPSRTFASFFATHPQARPLPAADARGGEPGADLESRR